MISRQTLVSMLSMTALLTVLGAPRVIAAGSYLGSPSGMPPRFSTNPASPMPIIHPPVRPVVTPVAAPPPTFVPPVVHPIPDPVTTIPPVRVTLPDASPLAGGVLRSGETPLLEYLALLGAKTPTGTAAISAPVTLPPSGLPRILPGYHPQRPLIRLTLMPIMMDLRSDGKPVISGYAGEPRLLTDLAGTGSAASFSPGNTTIQPLQDGLSVLSVTMPVASVAANSETPSVDGDRKSVV